MYRIVSAACLALALGACATPQPAVLAEPLAVGVTQMQLEAAIVQSLRGRDWKIIEQVPGRFVATQPARDGAPMTIAIVHTAKDYRISYVQGDGEAYGKRNKRVRGEYDRWIANLRKDIEVRLARS
jgi:hypothetical protein